MNKTIIKAKEGYVFERIHDNFRMGNEVHLGFDFSTGVKRQDLKEYYREVLDDDEQNL